MKAALMQATSFRQRPLNVKINQVCLVRFLGSCTCTHGDVSELVHTILRHRAVAPFCY